MHPRLARNGNINDLDIEDYVGDADSQVDTFDNDRFDSDGDQFVGLADFSDGEEETEEKEDSRSDTSSDDESDAQDLSHWVSKLHRRESSSAVFDHHWLRPDTTAQEGGSMPVERSGHSTTSTSAFSRENISSRPSRRQRRPFRYARLGPLEGRAPVLTMGATRVEHDQYTVGTPCISTPKS